MPQRPAAYDPVRPEGRRVYEVAAEMGVAPRVLLTRLAEMGEFVRGSSSRLPRDVESRLLARDTSAEHAGKPLVARDLSAWELAEIALDHGLDPSLADYDVARKRAIRGLVRMSTSALPGLHEQIMEAARALGATPRDFAAPHAVRRVYRGGAPGLGKRR